MQMLQRLYELPPKDVVRKIRRRLLSTDRSVFDLEEIASSAKHLRFQRVYDFLSRYEAIISRTHPEWQGVQFKGRRVLEIGCGPLLGWGPMAIFLGADCYVSAEPFFNENVLNDPTLMERYFLGLHKDLAAIYGPRMLFDEFCEAMRQRVEIHRQELLVAPIQGLFDVVLSNSCLEHVFPLEATLARLKHVSSPDCCFIHLVDFGNHRGTRNPFSGIYSVEPEIYLEKFGGEINLARAPDVERAFREVGFEFALVPYYEFREFYDEPINTFWRERYSDEELFLKTGLIVGPVGQSPA